MASRAGKETPSVDAIELDDDSESEAPVVLSRRTKRAKAKGKAKATRTPTEEGYEKYLEHLGAELRNLEAAVKTISAQCYDLGERLRLLNDSMPV